MKAVWDKVGPREFNLFSYEGMREWSNLKGTAPTAEKGDFETGRAEVFEVKAGKTAAVVLDCSKPGRDERLSR